MQKSGLVSAGALVVEEGEVERCGYEGEAGEERGEETHGNRKWGWIESELKVNKGKN